MSEPEKKLLVIKSFVRRCVAGGLSKRNSTKSGRNWKQPRRRVIPLSKVTPLRWGAYIRNQEAVAAAIARKEYTDMTPSGVGVADEFFALMDQLGILKRLAVEGNYQRQLIPMTLMMTTYSCLLYTSPS